MASARERATEAAACAAIWVDSPGLIARASPENAPCNEMDTALATSGLGSRQTICAGTAGCPSLGGISGTDVTASRSSALVSSVRTFPNCVGIEQAADTRQAIHGMT